MYPRSKFSPPNILPTRTDEGITRDDVDVGYMSSYNMRLIKIYHKDAELELQNVVLENAGVSDDVDYNPYLAKYLENSPLVVSTSSSSLERILSIQVPARKIPKVCYQRAHSRIRFVTGHRNQSKASLVELKASWWCNFLFWQITKLYWVSFSKQQGNWQWRSFVCRKCATRKS